jgi:hypothetical protein
MLLMQIKSLNIALNAEIAPDGLHGRDRGKGRCFSPKYPFS